MKKSLAIKMPLRRRLSALADKTKKIGFKKASVASQSMTDILNVDILLGVLEVVGECSSKHTK